MSRPVHVAFVATECVPFIKVGGLADVAGSLPRALESLGLAVDVIIPFEDGCAQSAPTEDLEPLRVDFGNKTALASVRRTTLPDSNVRVLMIENGRYFQRGGIYVDPSTLTEYPDQAERWLFFQQAALTLLARECPEVDVIHSHEHQTALIPALLEHAYRPRGIFRQASTALTIHNLGYQGAFPIGSVPGPELPGHLSHPGGSLEFYGQLNFMKCGILTADAVTVVSPTYANEIQTQEFGYGLDGVVAQRRPDLFGILNGIDETEWNPEDDTRIQARYSAPAPEDKQANRRHLVETFGLEDGTGRGPTLAMVSRIDHHKGFDLVLSILDGLLRSDVRFVLVGMGDPAIASRLEAIAGAHPGKAGIRFAFDNTLAHKVMAGADIFLMPSRYEPCGLTQMYALRYGAVPVVRATGGLADTVQEYNPETREGTGFRFSSYDANDFLHAIERAIDAWNSPDWPRIVRNGMERDFSWNSSAKRYLNVYDHALKKRRIP